MTHGISYVITKSIMICLQLTQFINSNPSIPCMSTCATYARDSSDTLCANLVLHDLHCIRTVCHDNHMIIWLYHADRSYENYIVNHCMCVADGSEYLDTDEEDQCMKQL